MYPAQRSWQPVAYRKRYNGRTSRRRTWLHHRDCIRCRPVRASMRRPRRDSSDTPNLMLRCGNYCSATPCDRVHTKHTQSDHPSLSATAPGPKLTPHPRRIRWSTDRNLLSARSDAVEQLRPATMRYRPSRRCSSAGDLRLYSPPTGFGSPASLDGPELSGRGPPCRRRRRRCSGNRSGEPPSNPFCP
jgi:hypothetical protein